MGQTHPMNDEVSKSCRVTLLSAMPDHEYRAAAVVAEVTLRAAELEHNMEIAICRSLFGQSPYPNSGTRLVSKLAYWRKIELLAQMIKELPAGVDLDLLPLKMHGRVRNQIAHAARFDTDGPELVITPRRITAGNEGIAVQSRRNLAELDNLYFECQRVTVDAYEAVVGAVRTSEVAGE